MSIFSFIITRFIALLGGVLPALLWLWFWRREDRARPEPRGYITLTFITGMITVPLVIPLERMAETFVAAYSIGIIFKLFLWAAIEEGMKFAAAAFVILRRKVVDEPLDPMIYMITLALGFSALENTFFLLNPDLTLFGGIITGSLRFFGATLLHTLASAIIGLSLAFSFYSTLGKKWHHVTIGLALAIILHTLFNFFIINSEGEDILTVFACVWFGVLVLLLFFEKIKRITNISFRN